MVRLHIKRGNEDQFLFESSVNTKIENLTKEINAIFNGRLKIHRICSEIEELVKHGIMLPPNMIGLTDEQVEELKLEDIYADKCIPSGGYQYNKDPIGRRNGRQPKIEMQNVLTNAINETKSMISKKLILSNTFLTQKVIENALNILKGAVTIVYPMGLPVHDPIRMEFTNTEDLSEKQASREVIEPAQAQIWFAGHHMLPEKSLADYVGKNDKSKLVVKIIKNGEGPPAREQAIDDDLRKRLMADAYRRQEELKKLEQDEDDNYLNSSWADNGCLKRQAHGMENIKFRFGM